MSFSPVLDELAARLKVLPGVGPKLAQRLALHLVREGKPQAEALVDALANALASIQHCQQCYTLSETQICHLCADQQRDQQLVAVVAEPGDQQQLELTGKFFGRYFVLNGLLSPIDGVGPDRLHLPQMFAQAATQGWREVILALPMSPEAQATSALIAMGLQAKGIRVTQLAQGIPQTARLSQIDSATLERSLSSRQQWSQ